MTCFICQNLLSEYIDGDLPPDRVRALETHVASCSDCKEELRRTRGVRMMLRGLPIERAPVGFVDRVNEQVNARNPFRRFAAWLADTARKPAVTVGALAGVVAVVAVGVYVNGGLVQFGDLTPSKQLVNEEPAGGEADNNLPQRGARGENGLEGKAVDDGEGKRQEQTAAKPDQSLESMNQASSPLADHATDKLGKRKNGQIGDQIGDEDGPNRAGLASKEKNTGRSTVKSPAGENEKDVQRRIDATKVVGGNQVVTESPPAARTSDVVDLDSSVADEGGRWEDDGFSDTSDDASAAFGDGGGSGDDFGETTVAEDEEMMDRNVPAAPESITLAKKSRKKRGLFGGGGNKESRKAGRTRNDQPPPETRSLEEGVPFDSADDLVARESSESSGSGGAVTGAVTVSEPEDGRDAKEGEARLRAQSGKKTASMSRAERVPEEEAQAGSDAPSSDPDVAQKAEEKAASGEPVEIKGLPYRIKSASPDAPARIVEIAKALGGRETLWPSGPPPLKEDGSFTVLQIELPADQVSALRTKIQSLASYEVLRGAPDGDTAVLRISLTYEAPPAAGAATSDK